MLPNKLYLEYRRLHQKTANNVQLVHWIEIINFVDLNCYLIKTSIILAYESNPNHDI